MLGRELIHDPVTEDGEGFADAVEERINPKAKPRRRLLDGEIYFPKEYAEMIPTLRTNKRKAKP